MRAIVWVPEPCLMDDISRELLLLDYLCALFVLKSALFRSYVPHWARDNMLAS